MKTFGKLFLNSVLGGIIIYVINFIGGYFSFFIGINVFTAVFIGLLGVPGAALLVIVRTMIL